MLNSSWWNFLVPPQTATPSCGVVAKWTLEVFHLEVCSFNVLVSLASFCECLLAYVALVFSSIFLVDLLVLT